MKFSTYARIKLNALKSYIDAVKRLGKMEPLAEETMGVSQFDLNTGSSKFQQYVTLPFNTHWHISLPSPLAGPSTLPRTSCWLGKVAVCSL
jgi:hypothetical protein